MTFQPILDRLRPDERAVVLHAGTEKTGTTYIQSLLRNGASLLQSRGMVYPTGRTEEGYGHHSLPIDLVRECGRETEAVAWYRELGKTAPEHLLISSESIYEANSSALIQLRALFRPRPAFPVVFFREPVGYLRSLWKEKVKHGRTESARKFVRTLVTNGFVDYHVNHEFTVVKLCQVFGDNVVCAAYDNVIEHNEDILTFFLNRVVGLPLGIADFDRSVADPNAGFPFEASELLRLINIILERRGDIERGPWLVRFMPLISAAIPEFTPRFAEFRETVTIDGGRNPFKTVERALARRHGHRFVNAASRTEIFERSHTGEIDYVDFRRMMPAAPDLVARAEALLADILAARESRPQ